MQRRNLLKLGVASAAVFMVAGGAAVLLRPGLDDGKLTAAGREVFAATGGAILDKTLPPDGSARQIALNTLLDRIDTLAIGLPPHAQGELSQLLSLLATPPGRLALAGLQNSWSHATVAEVQNAMQSMRLSGLALRQQAYAALHDIAAGAYFADESTWPLIGYPGPLAI